jgi:hypothetical protein
VIDLPTLMHRAHYRTAVLAVILLAVAIGAGIVIAGMLGSDSGSGATAGGAVTAAGLATAVDGLCRVSANLQTGDGEAARDAFYDKSHLFLHQLAAAVQEKDRDRATSLLVAKYRVEDLLAASGGGGDGASAVAQLQQEVAAASAILGLSAPGC